MARIRGIKPEIHSDSKTGTLSDRAFRIFIGLLNMADINGIIENDWAQIKAFVLPYLYEKPEKCLSQMSELAEKGIIKLFSCQGKHYIWIKNFRQHQKVDERYEKEIIPFDIEYIEQQHCDNTVVTPLQHCVHTTEGKGKEGIGKDRERSGVEGTGVVVTQSDIEEVFLAYKNSWSKTASYELTPERRAWIKTAILKKGKSGALLGVQNFRADTFADRAKFNDLEYLFGGDQKKQTKRIDTWCEPKQIQNTPAFQEAASRHQKVQDVFEIANLMAEEKYGKN